MDKSYVTMEQKMCPVCGKEEDSGALLLDKRLQNRFERHTTTGYGMCAEHQKQIDDGYIILVGAEDRGQKNTLTVEEAVRTGDVVSIRREVAEQIFNCELAPFMFIAPEVVEVIKKMQGYGEQEAD